MDWGLGNWVVMQGGCAGASLKECSSVHRHSKQQRAALLKLKILFSRSNTQAGRAGWAGLTNLAPPHGGHLVAQAPDLESVEQRTEFHKEPLRITKWRRVYHSRPREPERLAALLWIDRWAVGML
jgi:hypothetical protein